MRHRFYDLAFTPAVQAEQARKGSRAAYAAASADAEDGESADALGEQEAAFIAARDSFYLASVSETGWPYVQHRGAPVGFVRRLDDSTLGWAEYRGNRQYVSAGNTATNDRVAMIFMDYPHQQRLKVLGHMHAFEAGSRPDLARRLGVANYKARVERFVLVTVEAFDWNCPQHITPRYTLAEIEQLVAPLHARIAELEAQLNTHEPMLADVQHPPRINVMTATRICALLAAGAVLPLSIAAAAHGQGRAEFDLPGIAKPSSQEPARLIVAPPLPDALARGLAVIQYHAENLRIVPVYGPGALSDTPRIGHLHVTIDDAPWHWLDASNEPLIIQGLTPGPHRVLIELADPTHRMIDSKTVSLEIPQRPSGQ